MTKPASNRFRVIENTFIPLADGTKLAARIFLPLGTDEKPVPAILEYLPYRKRDGTSVRDESNYPAFAAAGYAGVRVDIRGTGESEGLFDDEYSPRELAEAVEVIGWIARQPWCDGNLGMMGISWGGFNALQVAALRPKPLKAIISIASTVDRFNDDIHYKGGALLSANLAWSGYMLAYISRPPDPALVGDGWRDSWLARLNDLQLPIATWLKHQTKDAYWRHGSISEDYSAIEAATLIFAGWGDGYKNAPPAAAANLKAPVKAINGPWIHKYPHFAYPHPRLDFHAEAIRWWDRWLKGVENGADKLPAYRAYITENVRPSKWRERDQGRWVAVAEWPSEAIEAISFFPTAANRLTLLPPSASALSIKSPQDTGIMSGEYFVLRPDGELPADQRLDDAGSLCFETKPLKQPLEILGRPRLKLRVAIDAPIGNLIVRLNDVHPDGVTQRVSFGVLNLAHRDGHTTPAHMLPGEPAEVEILLDECGHRFLAGHCVRIAISTVYWPLIQPPPTAITAKITLGPSTRIELPVRPGGDRIEMPEPAGQNPLPEYPQVSPPENSRSITRDLNAGLTHYHLVDDSGLFEVPAANGLLVRERREETFTIDPNDPLSSTAEIKWLVTRERGNWRIRTETATRFSLDATHYIVEADLAAFEGETKAQTRTWSERIPREHM